jgi:hypothetical protein
MSEIVRFTPGEVAPPRELVLAHQGIGPQRRVSPAVEAVWHEARDLYPEVADPVGMFNEIAGAEFAGVYEGEGHNEPRTPVGEISPRAQRLALFAVTLGRRISAEITARFDANDLALGCMLDAVASLAADALAERLGEHYLEHLVDKDEAVAGARALGYSPGYCGWHVSGQGKLFEFLRPSEIGITLRESYLMDPLKSVSGVVLVGPREIHEFEMDYSFCAECRTRTCRARINTMTDR